MKELEIAAQKELMHSYSVVVDMGGFKDLLYNSNAMLNMFLKGAEWQQKQSPWISVNKRMPEENENVIIMCKHGAIFNGTYCNGVWFCMDGYLHDTYKGNPIYSSMTDIPPLWEPITWMPIPKFNE